MNEVAKGTLLAFGLKVIGAGLAFIFNVIIARLLGAEGAGLFFLALSVTAIGSVIGRIGLDNTLLRFIATHMAKGEISQVKGVYLLGMTMAIIASGTLALLGFWLSPWIAIEIFDKPTLVGPLKWMSLAILPFAILNLQAESLKGLKRIRDALLVQSIGVPLVGILLIFPLTTLGGVEGSIWAYLTATILVTLLGLSFWLKNTMKLEGEPMLYSLKTLLISCKPLFVTALMNRALLPWTPLIFLGIWADNQEVGIFGAVSRLAMLVSFMLTSINNVLAPKFAELYANNEKKVMELTAQRSALMITLLTSPIFFLLIFGAEWVLSLFGSEFMVGAIALTILATGELINTLTGSVNHFLIVTGNELIVRNITVFGVIIQTILCLVLIPWTGIIGAAIATAIAVAAINFIAVYFVWKKTKIIMIPFLGKLN
ncbi:MAG: oligosaccharide flippase family protein [Nitrosomonas sp.]|nr:oligosaccharide flippase family protein [Nitrosomonas sp.]